MLVTCGYCEYQKQGYFWLVVANSSFVTFLLTDFNLRDPNGFKMLFTFENLLNVVTNLPLCREAGHTFNVRLGSWRGKQKLINNVIKVNNF